MGIGETPQPPVSRSIILSVVCRSLLKDIYYEKASDHTYILHANGLRYLRMRLPDGCVFQCDSEDGAWMDLHSPDGERLHGITIFNPTISMVSAAARAMCAASIQTKTPLPLGEHEVLELREMEGWTDEPY